MVDFLSLFIFKKKRGNYANNQLDFKKCHKKDWNWICFCCSWPGLISWIMLCDNYQFPALLFAKQSILVFGWGGGGAIPIEISSFCCCGEEEQFFFTPQNLLNGSSFCILGKLMNSRTFDEFGSLFRPPLALPFLTIVLCKLKGTFWSVFLNDLSLSTKFFLSFK